MGCAISGLAAKSEFAGRNTEDAAAAAAAAAAAHPSEDQIQMIKDSWKVIRDDIAKVGIIMFVRLFETHPECKDVFFLFRDVEDLERLRTSRELRAHGLRLVTDCTTQHPMKALSSVSHIIFQYVGAEFICAVQPILKERWTSELEEAWKTMFQYVTSLMNQGYQEESARQRHLAASSKERPDKKNTAL
uniref:Neuroglobin-like n=1 Tax=Stegastes partitus TaxID=144197 RepID=A0A3B5BAA8_9TELE